MVHEGMTLKHVVSPDYSLEITVYIELYKANIFNEAVKIEHKIFPKWNHRLHIYHSISFLLDLAPLVLLAFISPSVYLFEWSRFILIYYPINITSHNTLWHIFFNKMLKDLIEKSVRRCLYLLPFFLRKAFSYIEAYVNVTCIMKIIYARRMTMIIQFFVWKWFMIWQFCCRNTFVGLEKFILHFNKCSII